MEERKITVDLTEAAKIVGCDDENILALMDKDFELDLNEYCKNASYYMSKRKKFEKHEKEIREAYDEVWENMAYAAMENMAEWIDEEFIEYFKTRKKDACVEEFEEDYPGYLEKFNDFHSFIDSLEENDMDDYYRRELEGLFVLYDVDVSYEALADIIDEAEEAYEYAIRKYDNIIDNMMNNLEEVFEQVGYETDYGRAGEIVEKLYNHETIDYKDDDEAKIVAKYTLMMKQILVISNNSVQYKYKQT